MGHPVQPNVKFVPHPPRKKFKGGRRSDWSEAKSKFIYSMPRPAIYSIKYHADRYTRLSKRYDEMHPEEKRERHRGSIVKKRRKVDDRAVHHKARAASTGTRRTRSSAVSRRRKSNKPKRSRYSQLMKCATL